MLEFCNLLDSASKTEIFVILTSMINRRSNINGWLSSEILP
jgi:hypothetical protein